MNLTTERFGSMVVHDFAPLVSSEFRRDVITGLTRSRRSLPARCLHDAQGRALYERLGQAPEFYLERAEEQVLAREAESIAALAGSDALLLEMGAEGASQRLLDSLRGQVLYMPIDFSKESLISIGIELSARYPTLRIEAICADPSTDFWVPLEGDDESRPRLVFMPRSLISLMSSQEARAFLRRMQALAGPRGLILVGSDRNKDRHSLESAYNDAEGIAATLNLSLLERVQREFGVEFPQEAFYHRAVYDEKESRLEWQLVCRKPFETRLGGATVRFRQNEIILTECRYQYTELEFAALAAGAGLRIEHSYTDEKALFGVYVMSPGSGLRGFAGGTAAQEGRL